MELTFGHGMCVCLCVSDTARVGGVHQGVQDGATGARARGGVPGLGP